MSDIIIALESFEKVMYFVQKADKEISGFGRAVMNKDGDILIKDAMLCECVNSAAETDIDELTVAKAMMELDLKEGEFLWWWHSHVNMGVGFSGTDIRTTKSIGANGACVSTVFNKKRAFNSCYMFNPSAFGATGLPSMFVNEVPTYIESYFGAQDAQKLDAEFKAKYKIHTPPVRVTHKSHSITRNPYKDFNAFEEIDGKEDAMLDYMLSNYPKDVKEAEWIDFHPWDYTPMVDSTLMGEEVKAAWVDMFFDEYKVKPVDDGELDLFIEKALTGMFHKDAPEEQ